MLDLWTFLLNSNPKVQAEFLKEFCHMAFSEDEAPAAIRRIIEEKDSDKT